MLRTLTHKLLLSGGGLLLAVAIAAAFITTNVLLISTAVDHLTNHTVAQLELTGHFNNDIFRSIVEVDSFVRNHDPADRAEAFAVLRDAQTILDQLNADLSVPDTLDPELSTAHMELQQQRVALFTELEPKILAVIHAADRNDATAIARTLDDLTAIESQVELIEEHSSKLADQSMQVANATITTVIQRAIGTTVGLFGLFTLAVLALLLFIRQTIVRPIAHLSAVVKTVAEGDFDQTIAITNHDELGGLQATFNHLISAPT